jgi:hypothetical protein
VREKHINAIEENIFRPLTISQDVRDGYLKINARELWE